MLLNLEIIILFLFFTLPLRAQKLTISNSKTSTYSWKDESIPSDYRLCNDSVANFSINNFHDRHSAPQWVKASIVPAGLVTTGLIMATVPSNTWFSKYSVHKRITEGHPGFSTHVDNYLQYVPGIAIFTLKFAGVNSRSDLLNQGIILAKSQLLQGAIVSTLKEITHVKRPNGENYLSMPSGHTAQAFQLATMLDMEYKHISPWISVGGYTVAATTAAFRMLNNEHWDSDVMVGAGIGILSTKIVYLTHRYRWKQHSKTVLLPTIFHHGGGLVLAMEL